MLTYLKLLLSSIENIYFQESKDESKITDNPEKLRIFIGKNQDYIFINDENNMEINIANPVYGFVKLEKLRLYHIKSNNDKGNQKLKDFISKLKSDELIDQENDKLNIEITWEIRKIPKIRKNIIEFNQGNIFFPFFFEPNQFTII